MFGRVAVALLAALAPTVAAAKALPIVPDGYFKDWKKAGKPRIDPAGDAADGRVDLGRLWIANDDEALFLRFEVGRETLLQEQGSRGSRLRLYVDADRKGGTGLPVEGIGAEIEIRFGERRHFVYAKNGTALEVSPGEGTAMAFPTHSARMFEVRVDLPPPANPNKRRRVRVVLRDEAEGGDRFPDAGAANYRFPKKQRAGPVEPISLEREDPDAVRLATINVERSTLIERPELYRRLLQAIDPDVVAFQELIGWTPAEIADYLDDALPLPAGGGWSVELVEDVAVGSRFPILADAAIDANLVTHIDLPDELTPHDLVLFDAHPPCCDNDVGRDREVDHLIGTWRDLLAGAGPFSIDPMDAVVFAGDFNFVGFRRQFDAIVRGTFIDPANGPDFAPGRDSGSLVVTPARHTHRRAAYTWRNARSGFTPGRLDFIFFAGDVARLDKSFILDTSAMPAEELARYGLDAGDSLLASDHLPVVADLVFLRP